MKALPRGTTRAWGSGFGGWNTIVVVLVLVLVRGSPFAGAIECKTHPRQIVYVWFQGQILRQFEDEDEFE
jgi:hypothetical protein